MLKESSNNNNKNLFSEKESISKEKMICKDGFCSISNHRDNSHIKKDDINVFDPI